MLLLLPMSNSLMALSKLFFYIQTPSIFNIFHYLFLTPLLLRMYGSCLNAHLIPNTILGFAIKLFDECLTVKFQIKCTVNLITTRQKLKIPIRSSNQQSLIGNFLIICIASFFYHIQWSLFSYSLNYKCSAQITCTHYNSSNTSAQR